MLDNEDQAGGLRRLARNKDSGNVIPLERKWQGGVRVIAVTSGKGGVGKSTVVANLAVALAQRGARVLALDGDLGLANLDQMLGVIPAHTLQDVVEGKCSIEEVLTPASGVQLLPGCSGRYDLANMNDEQRLGLFGAIDALEERFDVLIVDTGAGIGSNAVTFAAGAQEVLVVTTPEPTAIRDAFAMIKVLGTRCRVQQVSLLPNMVASAAEAGTVHETLQELAARFFDIQVHLAGHVVQDGATRKAIRQGEPLVLAYPKAPAAQCIKNLARHVAQQAPGTEGQVGGMQFFWRKLLSSDDDGGRRG
jgi:flagellar biosynthesis protein FlhG